ncbi:uncharacterized protein G2W53_018308 [Senna tora]|uniref:Uncharacterized protein n=1 Tax=Senna tora TaxID=362788 RepID=A0A834U0B5_9FABA|nr:uncharacterized protein G2W53_018308 [Senna tora]
MRCYGVLCFQTLLRLLREGACWAVAWVLSPSPSRCRGVWLEYG